MEDNTKDILALIKNNPFLKNSLFEEILSLMINGDFTPQESTIKDERDVIGEINLFEKALLKINEKFVKQQSTLGLKLSLDIEGSKILSHKEREEIKMRYYEALINDNITTFLLHSSLFGSFKDLLCPTDFEYHISEDFRIERIKI